MMYRKLLQTLISTSIFTVLACAGLDNIPISESSDTQIEGATIFEAFAEDLGFGEFMNIRLVENEALDNQGVSKNQIDQVFITKLTLEILSPRDGDDFTFLESLTFKIRGEGLETLDIARGGNFEGGPHKIGLDIVGVDIAPYVVLDSMDITTEVNGRRPSNDLTVRATIDLDVDINVEGILCGSE